MTTRSDQFPAEISSKIHIDEKETSSLSEPLLSSPSVEDKTVSTETSEKRDDSHHNEDHEITNSLRELQSDFLGKAKLFSGFIGFIVGCFVQLSSLAANFLLTSIWGYNIFFQREFIVLSLLWCFATSILGVMVLLFLRGLVVVAFRATTSSMDVPSIAHQFVAELIVSVECSFAVSSLIGVTLSWTTTDILLDSKGHIVHSLFTLAIALAWCKLVMTFCSESHQDNAVEELLSSTDSKNKDNDINNELTKAESIPV